MKALKIINEINEQIKRSRDYGFVVEVHFNKAYQSRIEEAIIELEELKNRSCGTCKYGYIFELNRIIECTNYKSELGGKYYEIDFYCKNWEMK